MIMLMRMMRRMMMRMMRRMMMRMMETEMRIELMLTSKWVRPELSLALFTHQCFPLIRCC